MIEVQNITKRFGATLAVDRVSFTVNKGEVVGFLGPNGAGKTTTMRVMLGLLVPDDGNVRINGKDLWEEPVALREQVGYLPENTPLYEELPTIDFLRFIGSMRGLKGKALQQRVDEVIETCALTEMVYKDIAELSRGYRQRVGLASAIIHDPPCLILDEPTSGLDPTQIVEIRRMIRQAGKEKAILFSTHILDEAQKTSDRIIVISNGRIVAEGTPETLARLAQAQNLYEVEFIGDKQALLGRIADKVSIAEEEELPDGWTRFLFSSPTDGDMSEAIFSAVVSISGRLRKLVPKVASLEEVFLQLTQGASVSSKASPAEGSETAQA